ncbi:MAG: IS3 family transposase [Acidiferrobacterales bacterium]
MEYKAGVGRIKRLRQKLGIRCKQVRRFKASTDSKHNLPVAPNRLDQKFETGRPNETWVTDLTHVPTREGGLYLSGIKELCSAEIVGDAMGQHDDRFGRACTLPGGGAQTPGAEAHPSLGSRQYCSHEYQDLVKQFGMQPSMSRKGNCDDNPPMESFWRTPKNELVHHRRYETRAEAMAEITGYIEIFYNCQRRQSRFGYLSPSVCAQQFYRQQQAA